MFAAANESPGGGVEPDGTKAPSASFSSVLTRPALEARLAEGRARRLTIVVAGAGFGKSTLLGSWAARVDSAWYTLTAEDPHLASVGRGIVDALRLRVPDLPPDISRAIDAARGPDLGVGETAQADACAALICDALQERLAGDLSLVLDDLHELGTATASTRLIESICRQAPPTLHLVIASRLEPPFSIQRLRGQGQVLELGSSELAFGLTDVEVLLRTTLGAEAVPLAQALLEATAGWPAAVRLALDALRSCPVSDRGRAIDELRRPEGPLFAYLAAEVFEREPAPGRELIRLVAPLDRFSPKLCEALGVVRAAETMSSLARRGVFVESHGSEVGWFALAGLARDFALEYAPLTATELENVQRGAAQWHETQGNLEESLRLLVALGDRTAVAELLRRCGDALLAAGGVDAVLSAADSLPPHLRDAAIEQIIGQARHFRGDWEGAIAAFERAASSAESLTAGIAWRLGLIHVLRGELDDALRAFGRARLDGGPSRDEALVLSWRASAYWLKGDADACRAIAAGAFAAATAAADPQALAAAHTVLAMLAALDGDRRANDAHYLRALDQAELAGDLLQVIRIRTNRGSYHLEEGSYEIALTELDIAIRLADLAGFASLRALALTNRGLCQHALGRLEESIVELEAAKELYQQIGSRAVSYPLCTLGDVYQARGDTALARAAYEEAIGHAEKEHDVQGLIPALAGLARVLAVDEPEEAAGLVERALDAAPGMTEVVALLAAAAVALARGDSVRATQLALDAGAAARSRRDRAGLAEALELQALASTDPVVACARLEESISVWQAIHNPVGQARAELALARATGGAAGRALAVSAERMLRTLGARGHAAAAADLIASLDREALPAVAIESLGRFRILRNGLPVPPAEWQSKKARDLLKLLVARHGRPVPRDVLIEALWPDERPAPLANRLSVALSTVRAVLDPDKRFDPNQFVVADKESVSLDLANVAIDIERFVADATAGLALLRTRQDTEGRIRLTAAEAAYGGEFLEEDAYKDWAIPLREEARALYVEVARELADAATASGDHDTAARYFLRILERDGYDEQAHLGLVSILVAAGRHGDARRSFRRYAARMGEIGIESAPFPPPQPV